MRVSGSSQGICAAYTFVRGSCKDWHMRNSTVQEKKVACRGATQEQVSWRDGQGVWSLSVSKACVLALIMAGTHHHDHCCCRSASGSICLWGLVERQCA
eukprot:scaffold167847_cov20-Tisochrysis_lutea.AAC.1